MIEPIVGGCYKIKYVGGSLYATIDYEISGIFVKKANDNRQFIFMNDICDQMRYFIVYILPENILERVYQESDYDILHILSYINKCSRFYALSINSQSPICYINYRCVEEFIDEYYKPDTGEGYLEALREWNLYNR
jgi:hypothetical protein